MERRANNAVVVQVEGLHVSSASVRNSHRGTRNVRVFHESGRKASHNPPGSLPSLHFTTPQDYPR